LQEIEVQARIVEEAQVQAALAANAAAFQAKGGVYLMLTEAVENSSDAIVENVHDYGFSGKGIINIKIDTRKEIVKVIDNGTGIRNPFHILEYPFKSLKKDVDYLKGQFGRGLWGFMGFCEELTYISKRKSVDSGEKERANKVHLTAGRSIMLHCFSSSAGKSIYKHVEDSEFDKHSRFETGTVAIYEKWSMPFEEVSGKVQELYDRIQHHFGELIRKGNVKITIQIDDKEPLQIMPREFDPADRFPFDPVEVRGREGWNFAIFNR
jgi:histidine kinase/DNA gyrase B/HSP90-like ATPase